MEDSGSRQIVRHAVFVVHIQLSDASGDPQVGRRPPRDGCAGRQVTGLTPPAKALFAAVAASRGSGPARRARPTRTSRSMTADVRFFVSAFEGLSDDEVERSVLPFPSHEVDPYRGLAPHFDIASARARALHALTTGTARVVVASAAALLPRVAAPQRLVTAALTVSPGYDISPVDLGDLLAAAGYTRQDPVDESGEFCVRGGVVDFYPAGAERPIRLEFVGDTIESIRAYDPSTQRSTGAVDQAAIVPLTELPGGPDDADRSATFFDYLSPAARPDGARLRAGRGQGAREQGARPDPGELRRRARTRSARARSLTRWSLTGTVEAARLDAGNRARDAGARREGTGHAHRLSARARVRRAPPGLGRRDQARTGARRHDGLRRAHARAAPSARSSCSPTTPSSPCPSSAPRTRTRRRCSSALAGSPAASVCRMPGCRSGRRPTSSRKSGRFTSAGAPRRARSSPTSAI